MQIYIFERRTSQNDKELIIIIKFWGKTTLRNIYLTLNIIPTNFIYLSCLLLMKSCWFYILILLKIWMYENIITTDRLSCNDYSWNYAPEYAFKIDYVRENITIARYIVRDRHTTYPLITSVFIHKYFGH